MRILLGPTGGRNTAVSTINPDFSRALWQTVAELSDVNYFFAASDADSEYPTAIRVATQFQPESRVTFRICIGHFGIVPSTWGEVKSFRDLDDRMLIAPAARIMRGIARIVAAIGVFVPEPLEILQTRAGFQQKCHLR
jgi:hypothetical protein